MVRSFFDGHADTAMENFFQHKACLPQDSGHVNFSRIEKLENYAQFFAFCYVFSKAGPGSTF